MAIPNKYFRSNLNQAYVDYLENQINYVKSVVNLTEKMYLKQENKLTGEEICVSAMKDIRRHIKE